MSPLLSAESATILAIRIPCTSGHRRRCRAFTDLLVQDSCLPMAPFAMSQQMEKFKACEKEMKTKAFSKEGLIQSAKLDPKQQEKMETTHWLQQQVEELLLQVETAEAEIETLQGGVKKKNRGGAAAERLEQLERLNERRKWHIGRLELILRLLDNGTMSTDKVNNLKEDVSYFVESNTVRLSATLPSVLGLTSGAGGGIRRRRGHI